MPSKRERLSQVFLKDGDLVSYLIKERSSLNEGDLVVEIGPGNGIITEQLLETVSKVIAVEIDPRLFCNLELRYKGNPRIELVKANILNFKFPEQPYKIFSNIPFAIEGELVRRLMDDIPNSPDDAYLVVRREYAERWVGVTASGQGREGLFSVLHKPWYELDIVHLFSREDFRPKPRVNSALFRFKRRSKPFVSKDDRQLYEAFVKQGFGGGRRIRQNLSPVFKRNQLQQLASNLNFSLNDMPSKLTFRQWFEMFKFWLQETPENQKARLTKK